MLDEARYLAQANVELWSGLIDENIPLVGIEPSAILTFRDEYPDLVSEAWLEKSQQLSKNVFLLEEFIAREADAKRIHKTAFKQEKRLLKLHGHCQQKVMSSLVAAKKHCLCLKITKSNSFHRAVVAWQVLLGMKKNTMICRCK